MTIYPRLSSQILFGRVAEKTASCRPALPLPARRGVKAGNPVLEVCFEGRRQQVAGMEGGDKGGRGKGREEGEKDNRKLS